MRFEPKIDENNIFLDTKPPDQSATEHHMRTQRRGFEVFKPFFQQDYTNSFQCFIRFIVNWMWSISKSGPLLGTYTTEHSPPNTSNPTKSRQK